MEENNIYRDKSIGIIFRKPASWYFISRENIQEGKGKQYLTSKSKEWLKEFELSKEEFLEILGDPQCVITKYDPNDASTQGKFSPTITMQATPKESILGIWGIETFEDVINASRANAPIFLENFQVLKEYGQSNIDGKKAYEFDCLYTFKHEELTEPISVEMKSLRIETEQLFIDINCHSSIQVNEHCDEEFRSFINSLKIK